MDSYAIIQEFEVGMKVIFHKKNPTRFYSIHNIGKFKLMGQWVQCCTYKDIVSEAFYTRRLVDFKNFERVN